MKNKISEFIKARNKRELFMLGAIIVCSLAIWASMMSAKSRELSETHKDLAKRIATAEAAIKMAPTIEAKLKKLESLIDRSKVYSSSELQIAVENAANNSGLPASLSSATSTVIGGLKVNKISLSSRNQDLQTIARFEKALSELEPYVFISEASISGDKRAKISVHYEIVSFQ